MANRSKVLRARRSTTALSLSSGRLHDAGEPRHRERHEECPTARFPARWLEEGDTFTVTIRDRKNGIRPHLDAFGFDRCMWGTDWTRAVGMLTYKQGVEAFRVTDRLT